MLEVNSIVKIINTNDDESFKHYHKDRIGYVSQVDLEDYQIRVTFLDKDLLDRVTASAADDYYWGNPDDVTVVGYRYRN